MMSLSSQIRKPACFVLTAVIVIMLCSLMMMSSTLAVDGGKTKDAGVHSDRARQALVIGNSDYRFISRLSNPSNDAADMAEALELLGFEVTLKIDATHRTMETEILQFGAKLRRGGVGLFYFAGHGVQVSGRNYLIPIDADVISTSDIKFETVDAGRILGKMEDAGNGINIIILDACRNNPFTGKVRSLNTGLTEMEAPTGSILAYATAPGSVAADGEGRNGLYTSKLLKYMQQKGLGIEACFKKVRVEVMAASGNSQIPWESSSLTADFYFAKPQPAAVQKTESRSSQSIEMLYWDSIKDSKDSKQYQTYINEFPNGSFVTLAEILIQKYGANKKTGVKATVETLDQKEPVANLPPHQDTLLLQDKKDLSEFLQKEIKIAFLPSLLRRDPMGFAPINYQYDSALSAMKKQHNVNVVYAYRDVSESDPSRIWSRTSFLTSGINIDEVLRYCADIDADVAFLMKTSPRESPEGEIQVYLIDLSSGKVIYNGKSSYHFNNTLEEIESEVTKSMELLTVHSIKRNG